VTLSREPELITIEILDGVGNTGKLSVLVASQARYEDEIVATILLDIELWRRAGEPYQDKAIAAAGKALGESYKPLPNATLHLRRPQHPHRSLRAQPHRHCCSPAPGRALSHGL
jgi:hypothetical protein